MKTIYCVFSVANDYDQPSNNLEAWWDERPNLETLFKFFNTNMDNDETVATVVDIWRGKNSRFYAGGTYYRLEEVKEGERI